MALTPEDVVNQKFTITKFRDGYDLDQVDDFLDTIVEELRQREQEKAELEAKVAELTSKLEAAEAGSTSAEAPAEEASEESDQGAASEQTIVVDAPRPEPEAPVAAAAGGATAPDAIKSSAMLQLALELHDKYVHEGESTRERLIREGQQKHDEMIHEAEKRREDELEALANERVGVESQIKDLRSYESEYRTTLRSYIQAQLRSLDGSPEPAGGPDLP